MRFRPCAVGLEEALDLTADLLSSALPISHWATLEIHKLLHRLDDEEIDEVYQRWPIYQEVLPSAVLRVNLHDKIRRRYNGNED